MEKASRSLFLPAVKRMERWGQESKTVAYFTKLMAFKSDSRCFYMMPECTAHLEKNISGSFLSRKSVSHLNIRYCIIVKSSAPQCGKIKCILAVLRFFFSQMLRGDLVQVEKFSIK